MSRLILTIEYLEHDAEQEPSILYELHDDPDFGVVKRAFGKIVVDIQRRLAHEADCPAHPDKQRHAIVILANDQSAPLAEK